MKNIVQYKGYSLHLHENNPGHWLCNFELWAAKGKHDTVASENGYVRPPWKVIGHEHVYLNFLDRPKVRKQVNALLIGF